MKKKKQGVTSLVETKKEFSNAEKDRIRRVMLTLVIDPQDRSLHSALYNAAEMNRLINYVRRELTDLTNGSGFWERTSIQPATRERAALAVCRLAAIQPTLPKFSNDEESDVK